MKLKHYRHLLLFMWISYELFFHKVFKKIFSWPQGTFRSQALSCNGAWYFCKVSVAVIPHLFLLVTLVGLLEAPRASQWRGGLGTPEPPLENVCWLLHLWIVSVSLWKHCPYTASPLSEATFLSSLCSPLSSRRWRRSSGVSVRLSVSAQHSPLHNEVSWWQDLEALCEGLMSPPCGQGWVLSW